jgi:hypothetical protein
MQLAVYVPPEVVPFRLPRLRSPRQLAGQMSSWRKFPDLGLVLSTYVTAFHKTAVQQQSGQSRLPRGKLSYTFVAANAPRKRTASAILESANARKEWTFSRRVGHAE